MVQSKNLVPSGDIISMPQLYEGLTKDPEYDATQANCTSQTVTTSVSVNFYYHITCFPRKYR